MDRPRPKSRLAPALIVGGVLAAMLAVYVGLYFAGGRSDLGNFFARDFSTQWQCMIYSPAARIEAAIAGKQVVLFWDNEGVQTVYVKYPEDEPLPPIPPRPIGTPPPGEPEFGLPSEPPRDAPP